MKKIVVIAIFALLSLIYSLHKAKIINTDQQAKIAKLTKQISDYQIATQQAKASAAIQEKTWSDKLLKAEQNYNEKIITMQADINRAQSVSSSLSKQLKTAKQRLPTATAKASIDYTETLSNVFEQCVTEYTNMAKSADAERIAKERLDEAWP